MDPKDRIVEYLAAYLITDHQGSAADLNRMAEELLARLGSRRTIYSCIRQDLDVPCEHEEHEMDIIVLREG